MRITPSIDGGAANTALLAVGSTKQLCRIDLATGSGSASLVEGFQAAFADWRMVL
ncbi:hypothetical protein Q669_14110 [Labrenzia sp. C1B10]|jgi:hypothetical protein|nr:hypothetical protein Q669_14110 [Labrenzia sp. C1B10]ERS08196.1 hypothetical protein Q675_22740 [Labrenzia sp. C1B70]